MQNNKKGQGAAAFLDNLTALLADENRSLEDIKNSLRENGIDPEIAVEQFRKLLAERGVQKPTAAATGPKFSIGVAVHRANEPELTGIIINVRKNSQSGTWDYRVQFGQTVRWLPEESLRAVALRESPWDAMSSGLFSGIRHFVFHLTYHRLL